MPFADSAEKLYFMRRLTILRSVYSIILFAEAAMGAITVSVTPTKATVSAGQTQQFTANLSGAKQGVHPTGVSWTISPAIGTITASGLYSAPSISTQQTVTVKAICNEDPTAVGTSTVVILAAPSTVSVAVSPTSSTLDASQSQQLTSSVTGTTNTSVSWSVSPGVGSVSTTGVYSAPGLVTAQQMVSVKATSMADSSKSASASITLIPISISVTPASSALSAAQTQQYTANVTGTTNTGVQWSVSPAVGTISSTGLYTAPATITTAQSVTITAASVADPTKTAAATVALAVASGPVSAAARVNAGGGAFTDSSGNSWAADTGFTGGSTYATTNGITNTTSPALYQDVRFGSSFSYLIPVANGQYTVKLKFAEVYYSSAGQRVFNVAINGASVLSNFDIVAEAGGTLKALDQSFSVGVVNGQIAIQFTSGPSDVPLVNAIEVLLPDPNTVSVAISPTAVTRTSGQTQQFTAFVSGTTNTAVTWSLGTGPGSISSSGLYTAPATVTTAQAVTVKATSAADPTKSASASISLVPPPSSSVKLLTNSLALASILRPYSATLKASGGAAPYTWTLASGQLPPGVTLDAAAGGISGTPTSGGQYSATLSVQDSLGGTASKNLNLQVFEQPQDQYGGLTNRPCPNGPQPRFYTQKANSRWYLCTPAGNAFFLQGVSNVQADASAGDLGISYAQAVTTKYGDANYKWSNQVTKRLLSWGFNGAVENTSTYMFPFGRPAGDTLIPISPISLMSRYALTNEGRYAPDAMKSLLDSVDLTVYTGWVGSGSTPDVFDANFDAYVNGRNAATLADPFWSQWFTSPWVIGITLDDSDELFGIGPGLEQPGTDGVVHPHIGWLALASQPSRNSSSRYGWTYANPTVFSKQQVVADLQTKYGTISALNAAWGSNYTSFGTAGGWPKHLTHGTGLLDEDGSSPWLGTTDATLQGATAGVTTDLDAFLLEYWQKYFQVTRDRLKQYAPNVMLISPALNSHGGLTRKAIIQAAGQYCDLLALGAINQSMLDATAAATGDKPFIFSQFIWSANPDSSLWRYPNVYGQLAQTQADRANLYVNQSNWVAQAKITATQTKPFIGLTFWDLTDSWSEKANWGLVTFLDNAYDGQESVTAAGADSWGFQTGGEERNYGVFITPVANANLNMLRVIATGQ